MNGKVRFYKVKISKRFLWYTYKSYFVNVKTLDASWEVRRYFREKFKKECKFYQWHKAELYQDDMFEEWAVYEHLIELRLQEN